MRTSEPRREPIREPSQLRSQKRVERILDATKEVLAEHGSNNLKMSHVAKVAGISVSSIYQYFPNKSSILAALCDAYLAEFRAVVRQAFEDKPTTVTDLVNRTIELLEGYHEFVLNDPVWKDILSGASADKTIEAVSDADTVQNAEVIFDRSKHLFPEEHHDEVEQKMFLIITWGGKVVDVTIELPREEGDALMRRAIKMLVGCWHKDIFPLAKQDTLGSLKGKMDVLPA